MDQSSCHAAPRGHEPGWQQGGLDLPDNGRRGAAAEGSGACIARRTDRGRDLHNFRLCSKERQDPGVHQDVEDAGWPADHNVVRRPERQLGGDYMTHSFLRFGVATTVGIGLCLVLVSWSQGVEFWSSSAVWTSLATDVHSCLTG